MSVLASPPAARVSDALFSALQAVVGDRATRSPSVCEQHGRGEAYHEGRPPEAVVFPLAREEIVRLVRLCAEHHAPIIPFGAGTSLEGNVAALEGGVTFDFSRMNTVLRVSADDLDCTVEPGVTRLQLNRHLRDQGLFFPIDPGADATIGGMAATRASGTNAVRYGTMRENVLALTVVTPDGRLIETARRARKSAAGYDLTRLFVGSEGTLGVIADVTVRLYGVPECIAAAVCPFPTLDAAVRSVIELIQMGIPIARVELLDERQVEAVNRYSNTHHAVAPTLFVEFHGGAVEVDAQRAAVRAIAEAHGALAFDSTTDPEARARLWKARHDAYYAALALRPGGKGWITDVCVPISHLARCIGAAKRDLEHVPFPATIVGHVGDGNFHVILVIDPDSAAERAAASAFSERLVEHALALGGTCTGEHGIGCGKLTALEDELGEAVDLMRSVKRALDPHGIMNPGKILRR